MIEPYLNISNATNTTVTYDNLSSYTYDDQRFVSISVFILFGFIFVAGLVGNGLVVIGKWCHFALMIIDFT